MDNLTAEYWTYKPSPDFPPEPGLDFDIFDANGELIAVVFQHDDKEKTEKLAKLIAAAPEMYRLLCKFVVGKASVDYAKELLARINGSKGVNPHEDIPR